MRTLAALASGILFGLGLTISQMINPPKVLGFLDIGGDWGPSLALVMASAIPVAALGFALARRRRSPLCAPAFSPPAKTAIDARLIVGAVLFGVGLGLVGFCPGPALASLTLGGGKALLFVAAMPARMAAFRIVDGLVLVRGRTALMSKYSS